MEVKSKCTICRKHLREGKIATTQKNLRQKRIFSGWKNECALSLCEVLMGTAAKSFYQYFRHGEYCDSCLDAVRDVNFTWKQIKSLKNRLNDLSKVIQKNLKANCDKIEEKTEVDVVEGRISAAHNLDSLGNYTYDEITEIICTATSRQSPAATFSQILIKKDRQSFSGSCETNLPLKIELDEYVGMSDEDDDHGFESFSISDCVNYESDCNSNDEELQNVSSPLGERQSPRRNILKRKGINNNETYAEATSADESDENSSSPNDEADSDYHNSRSTKKCKSMKNVPQLKNKRSASGKYKSKQKGLQAIQKKKKMYQWGQVRLECPTCHKLISRNCFAGHQRTHTGEKPFVCSDCGKTFTYISSLWKHSLLMHAKLNPQGTKIEKVSIASKAANELASRGRTYHCDLCSWKFTWKYRYLRHLKDTHLNKDIIDGESFSFHFCDVEGCLLSFTSLSSLKTHISEAHSSNDTKVPMFECNVCQRIFVQQNNLETHLTSHEENKFGCDYCHATFPTQDEMENHKHRHIIVFQLSAYCHLCEECGERFTDHSQLTKHIKNLHLDTTIKVRRKQFYTADMDSAAKRRISGKSFCNVCQKAIYTSLTSHMYSHTHPNGFQCSMCPEITKTPKLLKIHERRVHNNKDGPNIEKTICQVCRNEVYANALESHSHFHPDGYKCLKCSAVVLTPELLQIHDNLVHPSLPALQSKGNASKKRKRVKDTCSVCLKKYDKRSLENHMLIHTHPNGNPPESGHSRTRNPLGSDSFDLPAKFRTKWTRCEVCDKTCANRQAFHKHLIRDHPEEYISTHPYVCTFCWKVFVKEEDRNSHVETTHNSFICSFAECENKRFSHRRRLIEHLNTHYNRKPFECPYCHKGFANDGNCRSHVRMVHTQHRSVRCKLCPDHIGFYVKKEFCRHVQSFHPEIPESEYTSILERRKSDVPVKIKTIEEFAGYPARTRKLNKTKEVLGI